MEINIYDKLMAAAIRAKEDRKVHAMRSIYGAMTMAHFLGAISNNEWGILNHIVMVNCLQNYNWMHQKRDKYLDYEPGRKVETFVLNPVERTVIKMEMLLTDALEYDTQDDEIEAKVESLGLEGIIIKVANGRPVIVNDYKPVY